MPIENWSNDVVVARVGSEPQFSETAEAIEAMLAGPKPVDCVIDFTGVRVLNSSNVGALLRIRKSATNLGRRLILCGLGTEAWGVFLVTSLDKLFEFSPDVPTALAAMQLTKK